MIVLLAFCGLVEAQTQEPTLLQLNHRIFTAADGVPAGIAALAQTPDGTLWTGSRSGLMRFDGTRFVQYPGYSDTSLRQINVASLLATSDGSLWISFRPNGVAILKHGRFTHYGRSDGLPEGTVAQFAQDRDGSIWAAARTGLAHFDGGTWKTVATGPEFGRLYGVMVDRGGTVWAATTEGLRARAPGESRFSVMDNRSYLSSRGLVLAASPRGGIWAAASNELVEWNDAGIETPVTLKGLSGGPLLLDAKENLWTADTEKGDLLRVTLAEVDQGSRKKSIQHLQRFAREDGLSAGAVYALLEDRERNVWVATNTALHRFSQSNVVRDVAPSCSHYGLLNSPPLAAGDAGTLWIACDDTTSLRVEETRDGQVVTRLNAPAFSVAYRDPEGTVWFGGPTGLARIEKGQLVTIPLPPHLRGNPVQALLRDDTGTMWVSVTRMGTYRLVKGEWLENGGLEPLPREPAYVATADTDGALWFGYPENRIAQVNGQQVRILDSADGLEVGSVQAILPNAGTMWVGGELGLARFDGSRFVTIRGPSSPFRGISGIIRSRDGDLWLNGTDGISRIERSEVERVLHDPTHRVQFENFNHLDGVPGSAVQLRPIPSAIEATDGRIWFAMTAGIVSIDPAQLARNVLPPPVTIWSLSSGAKRYSNFGDGLDLPVHTTDLQIEYSAGSLTVPERVRFRYKLDGLDREWQDVADRREARYTNLGPGSYTFRVTASNNDGVWNENGASLVFAIPPAFYQTHWFYTLCMLLGAAILGALYRMRMRQVAARVRDRLELRLAERERIARDLHDTLLQGVQGLIMKIHSVVLQIPEQNRIREDLSHALNQAQDVLVEGRDRVTTLRLGREGTMTDDIASFGEELAQGRDIEFRCSVDGVPRSLHPIVIEEGFLIVREALLNAFRHSQASHITAYVHFERAALLVAVVDDGCGLPPDVLTQGGRKDHWGIAGVHERAARIRSTVRFENREVAGTRVELRVPAAVAYRAGTSRNYRLMKDIDR